MKPYLSSALIVLILSGLVLATTASSSDDEKQVTHCATYLEPIGPGKEDGEIETRPVELGCFDTVAEAIEAGSGGSIVLPSDIAADDVTQSLLDASRVTTEASSYLIGQEWDNTSYGGSTNQYFASGDCIGTTWALNYVGSTWNDRFESGKGFSSCDHNKKFEHADYGGAVLTCTPNCSTYGVLRNEVSSLKWKD